MSVSLYDRLTSAAQSAVRESAGSRALLKGGGETASAWADLLTAWSDQLEARKTAAEEQLKDARIDYLLSVLDRQSRSDSASPLPDTPQNSTELDLFRDYAAKMRLLHPDESLGFYM